MVSGELHAIPETQIGSQPPSSYIPRSLNITHVSNNTSRLHMCAGRRVVVSAMCVGTRTKCS